MHDRSLKHPSRRKIMRGRRKREAQDLAQREPNHRSKMQVATDLFTYSHKPMGARLIVESAVGYKVLPMSSIISL
jgi:uncharacterized membrane protein YkvA (DUF1232 family)